MKFPKVGKKPNAVRNRGGRIPLNYYRAGAAEPKASPFVKKINKRGRTRKYVVRTLDIVVVIVLLYGLVYTLLVKSTPRIVVNDTTYHSQQEYIDAAAKQLGSLKNRNKITLNEQAVIKSLRTQFPELDNASIELPLFSETPVFHLSVARPTFFLASGGVNYIIDAQGVATGVAKNLPQIKNLSSLNDQSGFSTKVGQQVLSAQSVIFINSVLQQMAHAKVAVKAMNLPAQVQEVDLQLADRPYYVKFYLGGDALTQSGQFLAARHQFDSTGKQPGAYLDVRVPGKIFFK